MEDPLGSSKGPRYRLGLSLHGHTKESCRSPPSKDTAAGFCAHSGDSLILEIIFSLLLSFLKKKVV